MPWNAEYRLPARDGAEHTHWSLGVSTDEHAWQLLLAGRQRTWTATGPDLFEALRELRRQLDRSESASAATAPAATPGPPACNRNTAKPPPSTTNTQRARRQNR